MKRRRRATLSKTERARLARVERLLRKAMELLAEMDPPARKIKARKPR
jgi:hypothetical protein